MKFISVHALNSNEIQNENQRNINHIRDIFQFFFFLPELKYRGSR